MVLSSFMDAVLSLFTEFDMLKKPSETFEVEAKHLLDQTKVALTILLAFFAVEVTFSNNSFATALAGTLIMFTYNLYTIYQLHESAHLKVSGPPSSPPFYALTMTTYDRVILTSLDIGPSPY
ncbi:hypothetical protein JAAARDRAFT_40983 [Jaapia argillacea MUCL 33604]|uniref:Uncharacterized protein n=1 Tax=Jaapia argillacea MUCL 33604 TaxID=933084 RepID=A0A067PCH9_9AGAM|nr:hypothetical protein JAAARDRAFT_40983 [Jaapia argillacea MUCL 33604]